MKLSRLLGAVCVCVISFISMTASASLISRLGSLAYYDNVLTQGRHCLTVKIWPDIASSCFSGRIG